MGCLLTAALLGLLLLLLLGALLASRFGRARRPGEPPLDKGLIPWLGHALEFGKDAARFLSDMKKKHGDIFTLRAAGKFITVLLDPHSYEAVLWESCSKLDFGQYARILMDRMFDVKLPDYDSNEEKAMLRIAGFLTLFGNEGKDYDYGPNQTKDLAYSLEIYNEFYKLDRLLMKAARSTLSAVEKKEFDSIKNDLWKLLSMERLDGRANRSLWLDSYKQHLVDLGVDVDTQTRAMLLQLWSTQSNAGPAVFWLLLFLLKYPSAMAAVRAEMEGICGTRRQKIGQMHGINQEILDCTPIFGEAVDVLNRCLAATMDWMRANKLRLNPDKTEMLLVGGSPDQMVDVRPILDGVALPLNAQIRSLGVLLDPSLSLEAQIASVARGAFYQLRLVAQLRPYLDRENLASVVHVLVTSKLDYCNALYVGLPLKTVRKLQLVQNAAARLLTGTRRSDHITLILDRLHWLPICFRARFKVLVLTYKALHGT
ncbi:prostacyclin synthase isoform X3 [Rhineura floridana]|uniref:prostacyclin synthase isoform X3 n=1 Tax=Rhineura floridana TaxID=261503 RepID=UPI002AC8303B|nr:prostacyclin synthase isoform X3 [Rhineura floridana]